MPKRRLIVSVCFSDEAFLRGLTGAQPVDRKRAGPQGQFLLKYYCSREELKYSSHNKSSAFFAILKTLESAGDLISVLSALLI